MIIVEDYISNISNNTSNFAIYKDDNKTDLELYY